MPGASVSLVVMQRRQPRERGSEASAPRVVRRGAKRAPGEEGLGEAVGLRVVRCSTLAIVLLLWAHSLARATAADASAGEGEAPAAAGVGVEIGCSAYELAAHHGLIAREHRARALGTARKRELKRLLRGIDRVEACACHREDRPARARAERRRHGVDLEARGEERGLGHRRKATPRHPDAGLLVGRRRRLRHRALQPANDLLCAARLDSTRPAIE
mmetsp:Transcript_109343/g.282681  ORF Transcript_109343/g.282681 Transcript_109343/m.282681 type:complete len:216 (+) Transcript_109343:2463-3110(+)